MRGVLLAADSVAALAVDLLAVQAVSTAAAASMAVEGMAAVATGNSAKSCRDDMERLAARPAVFVLDGECRDLPRGYPHFGVRLFNSRINGGAECCDCFARGWAQDLAN